MEAIFRQNNTLTTSKILKSQKKRNSFKTTGCIKKTEQILNRSQRREAAQSMKFLINVDCLGTYDVE